MRDLVAFLKSRTAHDFAQVMVLLVQQEGKGVMRISDQFV
jgi:hypothetical protein